MNEFEEAQNEWTDLKKKIVTQKMFELAEQKYKTISLGGQSEESFRLSLLNLSDYSGLDLEVFGILCNKVIDGTINGAHVLMERLEQSDEAMDKIALAEMREHMPEHVLNNIAIHQFWIGWFVGSEDQKHGQPGEMNPLKADHTAILLGAKMAMANALVELMEIIGSASNEDNKNEYIEGSIIGSLGITFGEAEALAEPMLKSLFEVQIEPHVALTTALVMGMVIGRHLQRNLGER